LSDVKLTAMKLPSSPTPTPPLSVALPGRESILARIVTMTSQQLVSRLVN
jgi:hypothetical protein